MSIDITNPVHRQRCQQMTRFIARTVGESLASTGPYTFEEGVGMFQGWLRAIRQLSEAQFMALLQDGTPLRGEDG